MQKIVKDVFQDYHNENNIREGVIEKINLYKKSNVLELDIVSKKQLKIKEIVDFEDYLIKRFLIKTIKLKITYIELNLEMTIQEDWEEVKRYIAKRFPITKAILKESEISVQDNIVNIKLKSKSADFLSSYEIDKVLSALFMNLYGKNYRIQYKENVTEEDRQRQQEFLEKIQSNACKSLAQNIGVIMAEKEKAKKVVQTSATTNKEEIKEEYTPLIIGKTTNIKEQLVKIKDLTVDYGRVALQGKVIRTDSRELKNGKTLIMLDVYDGTSTITCKAFVEPEKISSVLARIKPKMRVKLQGNVQYDKYANEVGVIANIIMELPAQEEANRRDNAMNKRVELHLHTQMSQMDAITPAKELIKRAAQWGMKSIAITDHGVVQAFPEAKHAVDDLGLDIKVIYGVEAYFVPDDEIPKEVTDGWKKVKPYHAIILTQTQAGLKNLYKLISISHLNYYHKRPRVLESVFNQYREGLLLGSACEQGELYKAILNNKPEEKIERIANYYDYYEIQPLGNNNFMLREGMVPDEETLKNINRKIV